MQMTTSRLILAAILSFFTAAMAEEGARERGLAALQAADYLDAADAFREAAVQGDREAMRHLGDLAYAGTGVAQSYDKAIDWYCKAALLGDKDSVNRLGAIQLLSWSAQYDAQGWKAACNERLETPVSPAQPQESKPQSDVDINIVVEPEPERYAPISLSPRYAPWPPQGPGKPARPRAPFLPEGIGR
jgi:hypothetical protein